MSITMSRVAGIVEDHRASVARAQGKSRSGMTPENIAKGPLAAAVAKRAKGRAAYADLAVVMKELRAEGLTFAAIAGALTAEGHRTRYGSLFDAANVFRIIGKYTD
jgi:hypothetical protein